MVQPSEHEGHKEHGGFMTAFPRKVFDPVPPEVERVENAVLDAAFTVHSESAPDCSNRFTELP